MAKCFFGETIILKIEKGGFKKKKFLLVLHLKKLGMKTYGMKKYGIEPFLSLKIYKHIFILRFLVC